MQADRRPTVTDEVFAINDDLEINYGVFGVTVLHPA